MRLTERDVRLVRDIALSHILSRDQAIALGYFNSVTRVNTRLRELCGASYLSRLTTPFYGQALYGIGPRANGIVGERIATILRARSLTPRFVRHALVVTATRIALTDRGGTGWRFEAQLRRSFSCGRQRREIRPDGAITLSGALTLLEVDLGHVAPQKFGEKLRAYQAFMEGGEPAGHVGTSDVTVLTLTTGPLRRSRLAKYAPTRSGDLFSFQTFAELGIEVPGGWS